MLKRLKGWLQRDWAPMLLLLSLGSIFFLPRFFPTEERVQNLEFDLVETAGRELRSGNLLDAEERLHHYLEDYPEGAYQGLAHTYLAQIHLKRATAVPSTPDKDDLISAEESLISGVNKGGRPEPLIQVGLEIAEAYRRLDTPSSGLSVLKRDLQENYKDRPNIFARLLLEEAIFRSRLEVVDQDEILKLIDRYNGMVQSPDERIAGALFLSEMELKNGNVDRAIDVLISAEHPKALRYPELLVQIGMLALRHDDIPMARTKLREAERLAQRSPIKARAQYHLAEIAELTDNVRTARRIWDNIRAEFSPVPAISQIRVGRTMLGDAELRAGLEHIERGLREIESVEDFDVVDFDAEPFFILLDDLRRRRVNEAQVRLRIARDRYYIQGANLDPIYQHLNTLARIHREGTRLDSNHTQHWIRMSETYRDLGRLQRQESQSARGEAAVALNELANVAYLEAGRALIPVVENIRAETRTRIEAHSAIADNFYEGKYYHGAIKHYREYLKFTYAGENGRLNALNNLGRSLQEMAGHQEAIKVLGQLQNEFPSEPFTTPRSIILQAISYDALGHRKQAIRHIESMLENPDRFRAINPRTAPWQEAHYFLAHLLVEGARAEKAELDAKMSAGGEGEWDQHQFFFWLRKAKQVMGDFLDRYAESEQPYMSALLVAANFDLANLLTLEASLPQQEGVSIEDLYHQARGHYDAAIQFVEEEFRNPPIVLGDVDPVERIKMSYYLLGDLSFREARYEEAISVYERANSRFLGQRENIWGYIGSAIAWERLGNPSAAREQIERARNFLEDHRELFEANPEPFGPEFWEREMQLIERRLP